VKNKPHGFSQEYATNFDSVDCSAAIFKDKSNTNLFSMFVGELLKSRTWRYDRKKKDQVEISQPAIGSVYSSHTQNVDFLNRNRGRLLTRMRCKKMVI